MKTGSALLVCLTILSLPAVSFGEERPVVAVFGIHAQGDKIDHELLDSLTEYLTASVAECGTYRFVPPWNIQPALQQKKVESGAGCFDPECQYRLAGELSADLYISTSLTREADKCTVTSTLFDRAERTQLISARSSADCTEIGLVKALEDVAYFFILWGGCTPSGVPSETIESLYEEGADQAVRRAALLEGVAAPGVEEMDRDDAGSVPDMMFSAAWASQDREIGKPVQKSGIGHGVRFEGQMFLDSVVDVPVLKDFGFAGMYSYSIGYAYYLENSGHQYSAAHTHWQAELLYRTAFNSVRTRPAVVLRFGAGGADYQLEERAVVAKNTQYTYPYLAVDAYFMPYRPYIRAYASLGYLFYVEPYNDAEYGPFQGIKLATGIDVVLGSIHVGLGYEFLKFYKVKVGGEEGSTSDRCIGFAVRLGYTYH